MILARVTGATGVVWTHVNAVITDLLSGSSCADEMHAVSWELRVDGI